MTLARAPKSMCGSASTAFATTPGPLTPTSTTQSPGVAPLCTSGMPYSIDPLADATRRSAERQIFS
jgi:hypothetical protein